MKIGGIASLFGNMKQRKLLLLPHQFHQWLMDNARKNQRFIRGGSGCGMGKKNHGGCGASTPARAAGQALSLREESSRKTRVDEASVLRVKHLQWLAAWTGGDAGVGPDSPVGALLGRRLAASAEASGAPLCATAFLCQRCETVLKPGFNCTVRIKKNKKKAKRWKKSSCCQNCVAYTCNLCGDQNLILGSGKGAIKSLLSSRRQASIVSVCELQRGDNKNTRAQDMRRVLECSQGSILQAASSSVLIDSGSEMDESGERFKPDFATDKIEGFILSTDDIVKKLEPENANLMGMHETEPISSKVLSEDSLSLKIELAIASNFVTPQKIKLTELTGPRYSEEPFKTRSEVSKNGVHSALIASKAVASSSKSAPNGSQKNLKSSASDAAQVSGSLRKRARKGWTTLKQIAEKDDLERKEKMGNFVIPFFMQ
ncbi:hypothetical protein ACP4OV_011173 [Aristida adscensionis]